MAYKKPTIVELAALFGVHRNTMKSYIQKYERITKAPVNFSDIYDLTTFVDWMSKQKNQEDDYATE